MSDLQHDINQAIREMCLLFTAALLLAVPAAMLYLHESPMQVWQEWCRLITSPSPLVTDYFGLGSLPAAFLNAGLCGGVCTLLTRLRNVKFRPNVWSGYFLVVAHCFYGLNLLNMLPLMAGFYLHCKIHRLRFRDNLDWAMFITSFGPFVSEVLFRYPLALQLNVRLFGYTVNLVAVVMCLLLSIFFGCSVPALLPGTSKLHRGFNLYNGGLATGLLGLFVFAFLFNTMGIEPPKPIAWNNALYEQHGNSYQGFCNAFYLPLFGICMLIGWFRNGRTFRGYSLLLKDKSYQSNFLKQYPIGLVWINLGVYGLMMLGYFNAVILLTDGAGFSGATCGIILAAMTFSASGQHPKNVWPILLGYVLLSLGVQVVDILTGMPIPWTLSTQGYMNGLAFATGLCPFTGVYGRKVGVLAGLLSAVLCTTTGAMHGGFVLYNGGLTAGIAALILLPLLDTYYSHTEKYGRGSFLKKRLAHEETNREAGE